MLTRNSQTGRGLIDQQNGRVFWTTALKDGNPRHGIAVLSGPHPSFEDATADLPRVTALFREADPVNSPWAAYGVVSKPANVTAARVLFPEAA